MSLQTLLLLSCFLAFSSALTADLTKSFFFFTPFNDFVPQLINTENGVLAYSVETTIASGAFSYFPQYLHIDIESTNITQILNDTMTACGHGKAIFDRMYYHTVTSTLVYYCTGNNTLLILDHHDYTVQGAIAVSNVNDTFNETRLSAEGNSIVILGMGTPYSSNITATQLIKINLQTKQVIRHVTFAKGLHSAETVAAYVSHGVLSYILTYKVENGNTIVNIYSAIFVANIYTLKLFTSFNYIYDTYVSTLNDLFYVGDYVVSHNNESLFFFDKSGEVAYNYSGIAFNTISWTAHPYTQRSSIVMPPLTSVIYALFANQTIAELSFNGSAINSNFIASGYEMYVATGDQTISDLLFTLDKNNFNITDLQTLNLAYSIPTYFDIFYSKSHYCLVQGASVHTFDIATDNLIAQSNITSLYYYESSTQTLYFTQQDTNSCLLLFYNIETLESGEAHSFHDYNACSGTIIDLEPSNPGNYSSVQLTIWTRGDFIIVSNTLGEASMRVSELSTQVLVVQYDTLTAYQLLSQGVLTPDMALNKYLFNKKTRNFHLEATSDLTNQPVEFGIDFTVIDNETVGVSYNNAFTKINVSDGSVLEYNVSTVTESTSSFYDAAGQMYLILSGDNFENPGNYVPSLFSPDNQLSPLPMTDNFTMYAGGAGYCHYWVAEGFISGLQLVRVYNICPQEELMTIIS